MRIESVALLDFGPFHRRHIRLARGLNVVHGPNEAGKSTWLAGTYLALCGTRRGRGLARMERALEERHRPWDGRPWQAAAVVELADGRRVELRQELGARGGGQATDLALGRDVTGEITAEGAPDAARWLGLDRAAFLATACVRQAEVAAVTAQPELLREHLQRAAASGGAAASATAATALEQLDEYHRRHIGGERAAMRPLRRSRDAVAAARTALGAARAEHERYVALAADVRRIESELERAEAELAAVTAARARAVADGAARRLAAARGGQPSSGEGGDDEVAPEIRAAAEAWDRTRHTLAAHRQAAPPDPVPPRSPLDGASLHHLAHELETGGEPADAPAGARHGDVERRARGGILPWAVAALGAVLLLAGLAVAFAGHPAPGLGAAVVGAALAGVVLLRSGRREIALTELRERVGAERRRAAAARAADVGLAPDPAELRALAAALAEAGEARARRREWELIDAEHEARATAATDRLWSALAARGVPRGGDVAPALAAYREACRRRHARLQARFGGATPEELRAIAEDAAARADELARGVDAARLAAARDAGDDDVERAAARVRDARRPLDEARGHLRALEDGVGSVSDAEEALAAAETARARVERLDRVLTLTRTALERAQEDVHRSVAPRLAATLRAWLPRVTGGRWTDAAVDPAELDVRVCGPTREWRPAELLSQGTREQIYLLLRIALVEHLTRPGESSPLLFDEVTVHSDGARSAAVLDLLHELSRTHQVVLFTQEDRVLAWAERHRDPGRDRLVSLDAAAST